MSSLECDTSGNERILWAGSAVPSDLGAPFHGAGMEELKSGVALLPMHFLPDPNPFFGQVVCALPLAVHE